MKALLAGLLPLLLAPAAGPQLANGDLPALPVGAVGGGQVILEAGLDASGSVQDLRNLRETPPFTKAVREAVEGWRFGGAPEGARVLVAAVYRAPVVAEGPTLGEPPKNVGTASDEVPFPTTVVTPSRPPNLRGDGRVLVEVEVGEDGAVTEARMVQGDAGFSDAALTAARAWSFRPARLGGQPVARAAYLFFGFPTPVVPPPAPPK